MLQTSNQYIEVLHLVERNAFYKIEYLNVLIGGL